MMRFSLLVHSSLFILLHSFGFFIQIRRIINQSSKSVISSGVDLSLFFSSPAPLYILQYIVIFVCITLLFIYSQSYFSLFFSEKTKHFIGSAKLRIILWATLSNSALLIVNAAWFEHSLHLSSLFFIWPIKHLNTYWCVLIIIAPLLYLTLKHITSRITQTILALITITSIAFFFSSNDTNEHTSIDKSKPNIIFIGVDSLRNDLLISHMPFLSSQLKDSVIFENAITPLGRTYPAWNTILTGQYPVTHGARINLISNDFIAKPQQFIGHTLKGEGYRSIFAIDETRFANLGKHHGFDKIISPRTGVSDFIINTLSDYPLTNLISLFPVSAWLLPEIYANRAAATTYRAEAFQRLINRELPIADQPTFFAAHFCLAHWPYYFSSNHKPEWNYPEPYYPANLRAVDDQLRYLFDKLEKKGYLENSKIVFLSDHGEAWPSESPTFVNKNKDDIDNIEHAPKVYGHGSTLTSDNNRVIIALKGLNKGTPSSNTGKITSLADIAPTIYAELGLSPHSLSKVDGSSLLSPQLPTERYIPVETGTIITVTEDNQLNVDQLVRSMLDRYKINKSGLITIKKHKVADALNAKNRGIAKGNSILSEFQNSQFRLFDLESMQFEHFENFTQLNKKQPNWVKHWCKWYQDEYDQCMSLTDH